MAVTFQIRARFRYVLHSIKIWLTLVPTDSECIIAATQLRKQRALFMVLRQVKRPTKGPRGGVRNAEAAEGVNSMGWQAARTQVQPKRKCSSSERERTAAAAVSGRFGKVRVACWLLFSRLNSSA